MARQRKIERRVPGVEPSVDHALVLVQEYTSKIRTIIRRMWILREKYLAMLQKRSAAPLVPQDGPSKRSHKEEMLLREVNDGFQQRHEDHARYLRALVPNATKLAQHVSQLVTHGTDQTIVKLELGLRVAELESSINSANQWASTGLFFPGFD